MSHPKERHLRPQDSQLGTFDARLTNAGLLGDVTLESEDAALNLTSFVVPERLRVGRIVVEWILGILGFAGLLAGIPGAGWLVVAAVVFSLVTYFAVWLIAPKRTISIPNSSIYAADLGWVWRPQDVLFMGSAIAAAGLVGAAARTVSFRFKTDSGHDRIVVLHAKTGREAARLLSAVAERTRPV